MDYLIENNLEPDMRVKKNPVDLSNLKIESVFSIEDIKIEPCFGMEHDKDNELESGWKQDVETGLRIEKMFNMENDVNPSTSDCNINKQEGNNIGQIGSVSTEDLDISNTELNVGESDSVLNSELEPGEIFEENPEIPKTTSAFVVDRSVIPSVSKSDQAAELQNLEGLSVYNQETLEAEILRQVDNALEGDVTKSEEEKVGETDSPQFNMNKLMNNETEMERSIRLGEMTPFGTALNGSNSSSISVKKDRPELSILEQYLKKQAELNKKCKSVGNVSVPKKINKDPLKRKVLNRDGIKKKRRKKEKLGTETEDYCKDKPQAVPGEKNYFYQDNATDSEYVPSGSEMESSDEGKEWSSGKVTLKNAMKTKRKKISLKGYKLPEDWRSDDSDWESSDEEYKKKKRKSKKELDDGDIELYKQRLDEWEHNNAAEKDEEKYHKFDGGYKIPQHIWDKLYNYQKVGVRWLWELDRQRTGGILGDEMGLGKTIQIISFLAGLHASQMKDKDSGYRGLGPSLIVCPTTVMHQWVREFHLWFPYLRVAILHESGTYNGKKRAELVRKIHSTGRGVIVMSYTGAVQYKDELTPRMWHYVILDEGHKIRNPDAKVTLVLKQLKTSHRIILSGSPMQNNLRELWSLFDFIFPGKLGTLPVFLEQFAVPITQGGYANASEVQVVTAYKCATVLKDTISPYLLRRMKADVKSHIKLPEKNEQVLFCKLTEEQRDLYKGYVDSGEVSRILDGRLQIFMGLITLRKICNHPDLFSGGPKLFKGESEEKIPENERYGHWSKSGKMIVVETLLKIWKKQGHRVLLFTQGQQMLCILEAFIKQSGYKYLKLDGSTSISARQPLINKFNQDTSYFVMLLTTRVGGLGVNLTGANRVVIFDPDWNPATDTQARERAWRIGQKQSVTVYRLITAGTIEEKMYHRQIFKQFLTNKVLKDPRQRRFFKSNDLFELFTLKETTSEGSTETSAIFAGTNSEVKLDPRKSYRQYKIKKPAEPPEKEKESDKPSITFSKKKIEHMKKLAQRLSMNFGKKIESNHTVTSGAVEIKKEKDDLSNKENFDKTNSCESVSSIVDSDICVSVKEELNENGVAPTELAECISSNTSLDRSGCSNNDSSGYESLSNHNKLNINSENISNDVISNNLGDEQKLNENSSRETDRCSESSSSRTNKSRKKHSKHKSKRDKKRKYAKFDGEVVPHLVKKSDSSSTANNEENEEAKNIATQDEYVLKKLFDKSGLQTAMKHDTIMEGGPADYALVEGEAEKVASKAVAALKKSRRECPNASSGVPTFTGSNGFLKKSKSKFTGKFSKSSDSDVTAMSSSSLLQKIKNRNLDTSADTSEVALLRDIRDFMLSEGSTTTTDQLVSRFKDRLPIGKSAMFKALLSKISVFYRAPDNKGYWTLREEFMF